MIPSPLSSLLSGVCSLGLFFLPRSLVGPIHLQMRSAPPLDNIGNGAEVGREGGILCDIKPIIPTWVSGDQSTLFARGNTVSGGALFRILECSFKEAYIPRRCKLFPCPYSRDKTTAGQIGVSLVINLSLCHARRSANYRIRRHR